MPAIRLLIDPDGSVLLVAPGEALIIEPAPAAFAYKTVEVNPRLATFALPGRQAPVHVGARTGQIQVEARAPVGAVAARSHRVRVTPL